MSFKIFKSSNKMLILEKGMNTDYIYTLLTSLFYVNSQSVNKILDLSFVKNNLEINNALYLQEFIRSYIITHLRQGFSIEKKIVNRFRIFLYRIGLFDQIKNDNMILPKLNIFMFYEYLISDIFNYKLNFEIVDILNNITTEKLYNMIEINSSEKIIDLSKEVDKWISTNILRPNCYYKFKYIPSIIPIKINKSNEYVNIMEGIKFKSNSDNIQQLIIFEIHSIICKDEEGNYYSIVKQNSEWFGFSENRIPSNFIVDLQNFDQVKKIMSETELVFYKSN